MADKDWIKKQLEMYKNRREKAPTIIRIKKRELPFVQIDKRPIEDKRLSWKAKGLLLYLISKPDDWQIFLADLMKRSTDKRTAVSNGLEELEKHHYLEKERIRNDRGQFIGWLYTVYEIPKGKKT